MIKVYTSRKLETLFKPTILQKEIEAKNDALQFNAHPFIIDRKKCIFFTQKLTCYSFAIMNYKKADLKNIDILFYKAFEAQLMADHLYELGGEKYLELFTSQIQFFQTDNDQKTLGIIRDSIYRIDSWRFVNPARKIDDVSKYILSYQNTVPIGSLKYKYAKELMLQELKNLAQRTPNQIS